MTDELRTLVNDLKTIDPAVRGTFTTYLIIQIIRDLAYYAVVGIVTFTLGRRLIHAILAAYRESKRAAS